MTLTGLVPYTQHRINVTCMFIDSIYWSEGAIIKHRTEADREYSLLFLLLIIFWY